MSFRCTACFDKSYDKAWKLQRHIRDSVKCFEQLNPGISAIRFPCASCDYTSPRGEDLKRHRRLIHPEIAITTATSKEEAGQPTLGWTESCNFALCLHLAIPRDTNERSDEIERFDLRPTPESPRAVTKRKSLVLDDLSPEPKRVCIEPLLPDLDTLSLVDDSGARRTLTPKTTENEEQDYLTSWQPTAGGLTALVVSTSSARLQHASSSSTGSPKSISVCGSSIGSLFGRPTTHAYEPWRV